MTRHPVDFRHHPTGPRAHPKRAMSSLFAKTTIKHVTIPAEAGRTDVCDAMANREQGRPITAGGSPRQ